MKNKNDFIAQVAKLNLTEWNIRNCSLCEYPLKYIFTGSRVCFDSGCYCTNSSKITEIGWDHIVNFYNMQTHPDVIKEMNEFWGFEETT